MSDKSLKSCPRCGQLLALIEKEDGKWQIVCTVCDFEDGPYASEEEALARWQDDSE